MGWERRDYRRSKSKYIGGRRRCDYPKTSRVSEWRAITLMGVIVGPKSGGKHGYVEECVRERATREEMTKGW